MKTPLPESDIRRALEGLKDFQRRTVDYVFQRLYLDEQPAKRMPVSDEVGLGKTLVARGVLARTLKHLWDRVPKIDIVYVCSNADIARQNVNRLEVLQGEGGVRTATRLTLLAKQLASLKRLNFIALTPATSFDLGSSLGVASERVLLYWLLREVWGFGGEAAPLNLLRGNAGREGFRDRVRDSRPDPKELAAIAQPFARVAAKHPDIKTEFEALCDLFGRDRIHVPTEHSRRRNRLVGRIRAVLARTCVEALNPDLVILDEFQRFKHLMQDEDDASELARELFDYSDEHGEAKVLLLSATPYKMLTLSSQGDDEDHYRDFLDTLKFLEPDAARYSALEQAVSSFRLELLRLRSGGNVDTLLEAKRLLEEKLRRVMVRTERLAATADRGGMLCERPVSVRLSASDVVGYAGAQAVSEALGEADVMEFWKSAPYVLNFLDGYKLRDKLKQAADDARLCEKLAGVLREGRAQILSPEAVRALAPVEEANPRFRALLKETVDNGAWQMLWLPPCLPYYHLGGPFADPARRSFTKQLVFSAWRMVPRSISTLVSHAADLRAVEAFERGRDRPSTGASRWPSALLRFQKDTNERLTGMPLFLLLYPSLALAQLDPLVMASQGVPDLEAVLGKFEEILADRLKLLTANGHETPQPDERWYWAAPLLLDNLVSRSATQDWLGQDDLAAVWQEPAREGGDEGDAHWEAHIEALTAMAQNHSTLGTPPSDLARVLAEAALGSPAVAAYRALRRQVTDEGPAVELELRNAAAETSWAFRNLFNLPESIAILRGMAAVEPYWRRVLQYCGEGGLQAILDEYCHYLVESSGLASKPASRIIQGLTEAVTGSLGIRPAAVGVDRLEVAPDGRSFEINTARLRSRYAMPFADARPEDTGTSGTEGEVTRMEKVRDAFNSPFWPFVLVSTSVGQEGLDFHPYCHSVMHWNLPSNPVDLEQREGRVHRYKGHAVRKNVATAYGNQALATPGRDPWQTVFRLAYAARSDGTTDMVPYWLFPLEGGAKIERRVPALPLSREILRMADLRRTLAVYRMVFGQPRQEDLIEFLTAKFEGTELDRICSELRVDLTPV